MIAKIDKNKVRQKRHGRVRNLLSGTSERPRLNVYRSNKHIYAQLLMTLRKLHLQAHLVKILNSKVNQVLT